MRIGVVGGGVLGLTLAYRLAGRGHRVELFEAADRLGGLAVPHDYGDFVWDRFYHCILPTDARLIGLLEELGLGDELRWRTTRTGYHADGRTWSMSGNADFLRFPLLSWLDKLRLAATVVHATRFADPWKLYTVTAEEWLVRWCGRRGYEVFWRPLLRAKFGPYHDRVAAVFIWATLTRLVGARSTATSREKLGYCRGGYARILGRLEERLRERGVALHTGCPVSALEDAGGDGCRVVATRRGATTAENFDRVLFTAPSRLARRLVDARLAPVVDEFESRHPTSSAYLGVACLVLALRRPLTPFYVLNIGDENVELTGLIEMTNLVDADAETAGRHLVYLPRYLDSEDPLLQADEDVLRRRLLDRGVRRLFPDLADDDITYARIHRARHVQPLPLVRSEAVGPGEAPSRPARPLQLLNTAMLRCATLNNDEVVGLVDRFLEGDPGL